MNDLRKLWRDFGRLFGDALPEVVAGLTVTAILALIGVLYTSLGVALSVLLVVLLLIVSIVLLYVFRKGHAANDQTSGLPECEPAGSGASLSPGDDFDDTVYRKWLAGETEYIDIRGIGERRVEDPIVFPILTLYTELFVQTGLTNLDLDQGRRGRKRISLAEIASTSRRLVIMGDPGSGKTTFLRFLARKQVQDCDSPLPIFLRVSDIYEYAIRERIGDETHGAYGQEFALSPGILIDYCMDLSRRDGLQITRAGLERRCDEGKCTWLLDSVDELPSQDAQQKLMDTVRKASEKWRQCRFILTSRATSIRGWVIPVGFDVVGIDQWDETQIKAFLQVWTGLLYPNASPEARRRHWGGLLATILERQDLRSLARNAVMLTAMAVVHYNEKRLPEGRADLLEAVIYWLVRAKTRSTNSTLINPKFVEDRYRELALCMFEAEGGRRNRVGMLWAAERIAKHFGQSVDEALAFLGREETETGVLVRHGEGDLAFWHLSFQEYLAAKEIAGKTDRMENGWWSKIRDSLDKPEWREVLVLVPACLNRLGSERVDLFFERLAESCVGQDLTVKARRVGLAGSILRDLRLTGYELGNEAKWGAVLKDIAPIFGPEGSLLPLETRYDAAVEYGLGGDERLHNFDETWVVLPGDMFLMGAQAKDPSASNFDADATPWEGPIQQISLTTYEIRKYPITVQEYALFVDDGGYEDSAETVWNRYCPEAWDWRCRNQIRSPLDWDEQRLTPNCPVTGVSWYEASAYCAWLTLQDLRNLVYRLPTEAQWEYAAKYRLPQGQRWPWGNSVSEGDQAEANFAWSGLRRKTPIGLFPKSNTPLGVTDMFGNVEEWCADSWRPDLGTYSLDGIAYIDPYDRWRAVRGGSTIRFSRLCRPTYRSRIHKVTRYRTVGFRAVREAVDVKSSAES